MQIITLETPSLGDRTYVVHDGTTALVVDPQRDVGRVLDVLDQANLTLVAVVETHIHNDYVSGGLDLANRTGASLHVPAGEGVSFAHTPASDGDVVTVGSLQVKAVHTPGHTPTHLSWVVSQDGQDKGVFTGGGLLFGSVGRTDLISPELTTELSRAQHRSAHRLGALLGDTVEVLPTHGFGSFCSSGETSGRTQSTIGQERQENQAFRVDDEEVFVKELLAGLDAWPAYYVHMGPLNRQGPAPIDLTPPALVDVTEISRRIHAGDWVVDLRSRRAFAGAHLVGTINIARSDSMSTHLGWLIQWGTSVTLVGERDDVEAAQLDLARIGIDELAGQAQPADVLGAKDGNYVVSEFVDLKAAVDAGEIVHILDTRRNLEHAEGHLAGAQHIPLHELLERMGEVPTDRPIWVHCASGQRAAIAASLIARTGREVVLVDDAIEQAARCLEIVR